MREGGEQNNIGQLQLTVDKTLGRRLWRTQIRVVGSKALSHLSFDTSSSSISAVISCPSGFLTVYCLLYFDYQSSYCSYCSFFFPMISLLPLFIFWSALICFSMS